MMLQTAPENLKKSLKQEIPEKTPHFFAYCTTAEMCNNILRPGKSVWKIPNPHNKP